MKRAFIAAILALISMDAAAGFNSWTGVNLPNANLVTFMAAHPADPNIVFAGSRDQNFTHHIARTTNGGTSWSTVLTVPNTVSSIAIDPNTPTTIFASAFGSDGAGGWIYRSTNGGTDWTLKNFGLLTSVNGLAVDAFNAGTVYARTSAGIFKSTNSGDSWSQVNALVAVALAVDPANGTVLAAGQNGMIRSANGGTSWSDIPIAGVTAIAFQGTTGTVYAGVQFEGGVHKSADGGATWTNINSRFLGPSLATFTSAGTPISSLVVGSGPQPPLMAASGSTAPCGFYKSLDGGLTFTQANGGLAPVNNAPLMYCGNFAGQHIAHSPAAPSDFFAGMSLRDVFRHTVDASALPPICSLSANPTTIAQGVSSTLTAYCSPAATSYVWSSSAGFSSNSAGGLVSPTQTTTYTVQGVNANGSSAVVGVTVYAPSPRPVNVATRGQVLKGENVLIAGFAIDGPTAKTVVVRGRGPSLVAQGIAGSMGNPTLRLASSQTNNLRTNDDWGSAPNAAEVQASGFAPSHPQESAIMMTLNPGLYTAVMSGSGGSTGVGIVEVFEVDHPEVLLVNISTRGLVETGDNVMIAGFVVNGSSPLQVVVRARGPSLSQFGILNPLANPALNVFSGQTMIGSNDNWQTAPNAAQVQSLGYAPSDANESAILISLSPGAYTAVMSGVGNTTGVGIVEVFAVP